MPNSGGGKTKESVYITVEALGVKQASDQIKSTISPLQQLKIGAKDITAPLADVTTMASNFANILQGSALTGVKMLSEAIKTLGSDKTASWLSKAQNFISQILTDIAHLSEILHDAGDTFRAISGSAGKLAPIFLALKGYTLVSKAAHAGLKPAQDLLAITDKAVSSATEQVKNTKSLTAGYKALAGVFQDIKAKGLSQVAKELTDSKTLAIITKQQGPLATLAANIKKSNTSFPRSMGKEAAADFVNAFAVEASKLTGGTSSKVFKFATDAVKNLGKDLLQPVTDAAHALKQPFVGVIRGLKADFVQQFSDVAPTIAQSFQLDLNKAYNQIVDNEGGTPFADMPENLAEKAKFTLPGPVKEALKKDLKELGTWGLQAADGVYALYRNFTKVLQLEGPVKAVTSTVSLFGKTLVTMPIGQLLTPVKILTKEFLRLSAAILATPVGMLTAGIAALTAGVAYYVKSNEECLKTFEKLNPEIMTSTRNIAKMKDEYNALSMAVDSLWGRDWDNLVGNIKFGFYQTFNDIKTAYKEFMLVLFNGDTWKDRITALGNWIKLYVAEVAGAIWSTMTALAPNKLLKATGLSKVEDFLGKTIYDARTALQKGVQDVEGFNDQLRKAEKYIEESKNKTKETEKPVANIKNNIVAIKDEFADIVNLFADWQIIDGNWWLKSLDDKRKQLVQVHEDQLAALERIEGDPSVKASYRMQLEEDFQKQLQDIELENARETGNQQLIIARQYMDMERQAIDAARQQRLEADKAASDAKWQHELDKYNEQQRIEEEGRQNLQAYLSDVTGTVKGTLTDAFMSMFDMISGDVEDIRGHLFDMFNSMAQNLFRTSLDAIVNSIIKMSMESGASAAQTPIIGPALAIAAVSGTMALGMAIAKRNQKKKPQIQYATGGYISEGLVRGAGGSGDSVEALLQPGERILSKRETEAYDKGRSSSANITVNVTINGQLSSQSQIRDTVRSVLIPEIRSAVKQGYSLGVA